MSILIKGMEMPKTGEYRCVIRQWKRGEPLTMDLYGEEELCGTITPIPPHGRCIDADAMMLKILDYIEEYSDVDEKGWHNLKWCAMKEAEMAINSAPTIIEAEEGET